MSLFGNRNRQQPQMMPQQAVSQLQADPVGTLKQQCGWNIPVDMNNPRQMVQHLVQTGQVPQGPLQQVMQIMEQMMGR